jgi:hypothetical protein
MKGGWSHIGVLLAANFLFTAPFAHLHLAGHEHQGAPWHWHLQPQPGQAALVPAADLHEAVDLDAPADTQDDSFAIELVAARGYSTPDLAVERVSSAPPSRSHDPPNRPPSAPRAPPV